MRMGANSLTTRMVHLLGLTLALSCLLGLGLT